jgi:FlaG/FlaF family flagellin (archaellin)
MHPEVPPANERAVTPALALGLLVLVSVFLAVVVSVVVFVVH